ncbi:neurofilament medium polypeptide-like isoform X1 [Cotesia glomerata]|uniref:neurofilament medium polypeptide-like isoform X1 n=1 Tax=Cotesia glomerata TaxID=32391 RepID=UPI001D0220A3|nr:neurofilament medium polypeptide-like isoform X1 [Cotesia glomerata]
MARRRSLNRRRSRGSLNNSGVLNDDTNVYNDDDELWFRRLPDESNMSKYLGSTSSSRYSKSILNPDSGVIQLLGSDESFWQRLDDSDSNMMPRKRTQPSPKKSVRKSNMTNETLTSESSTIPPPKRRKLLGSKPRKSTGDVFSQAFDSEPAVESEPARASNRHVQDPRQSLSQSEMIDRGHRSGFQSSESEHEPRAKRTIFKKPRRASSGISRVSLYEKVLDETDVSAVGPSQPPEDRRTIVKPRTTFSNSPRYSSQNKNNLSQRSSTRSKNGDGTIESDSDLDLASQQRPRFRQHVAQSGDPFASIISETSSEKEQSPDQSKKSISISESRRDENLRPEIENQDENDNKSLTSGGSQSNSRSSNNFVLRDSAGEHSDRGKNLLRTRASSVHSDISENKSSTTSISETFKSIENLPLEEETNSQNYEPIEEEGGEEPMETEEILNPSQSQKILEESIVEEASGFRADDFEEDEEVVDKENRKSLNNLEDVDVSQAQSPKKGRKSRQTSDAIISQQEKEISRVELNDRRRTRQSEGESVRNSPQARVEVRKKSVGKKSHRRVSEVDNLNSGIEADKSLSGSARKTRSGRVLEDGTPEKSLGKGKARRSKDKVNEEEIGVSLEKSLTDSQRKTWSGRVSKEVLRDGSEFAERSRIVLEEGKKIQRRIFGDSEDEDEVVNRKVKEVGGGNERLGGKDHSQKSFDEVEGQEAGESFRGEEVGSVVGDLDGGERSKADDQEDDEKDEEEVSQDRSNQEDNEKSQEVENQEGNEEVSREVGEEISSGVENQEEEEEISLEVENQEGDEEISPVENQEEGEEEEISLEVENQESDEGISPEVENQEGDEEISLEVDNKEDEEAEEEIAKKTPRKEKEISRIESIDRKKKKSISKRKSKLGSPKHSSTRYFNKDKSSDEFDSDEIDEELDKYVRNTSKMSLQNKSKPREINPTPSDLPFRESDSDNDNLGEAIQEGIAEARPSETRPGTSRTVNKAVESNKSVGSKQLQSNQRSILSFFSNSTARPSLHISTKPLASSDLLKEVDARMKEIKKRRDESFAKQMEEEMAVIKAKPVKLMPVKKKVGVSLVKKSVKAKEVNKAFIVNGVVYRKPRLPRPKHWATDRLYKFLWKKMEAKYELQTRLKSEKFVTELAKAVEVIIKKKEYKDYKFVLEELMKKMARLGIIVTRKDFYDFCYDFLPYEFREKVTPMLLPGAVHLVPFEPQKLNTPILEG